MELTEWLERQREWSLKTFGPGRRTLGLIEHIRKELKEIEADPTDPMEWVDVFILAMDGAHRNDYGLGIVDNEFNQCALKSHLQVGHYLLVLEFHANSAIDPRYFVNTWVKIAKFAEARLRRMGYTWPEIMAMLEAKQIVNMRRQWPPWLPEDKATEHVRGNS